MKRYILIIISVLSFNILMAQTQKGKFIIDQSLSFKVSNSLKTINSDFGGSTAPKRFSLEFSPSAAYFIMNNLALGLGVDYNINQQKDNYNTGDGCKKGLNRNQYLGLSPYVKYFFGDAKIKPFVSASLNIGRSFQKRVFYDRVGDYYKGNYEKKIERNSDDFIGYTIEPGVSYFINNVVSLNLSVYYKYSKELFYGDRNSSMSNDNFGVNFGFSVFL